jgi:3-isopropylmalate/(R)-2-methylmalate dehydratase small subunit
MALTIIKGRVWKFGDNISTDFMMPSFMQGKIPEERAAFCMRANRPEFARNVRPGDMIVGGKNFGCGSSRPAAENLLALGINCVLAESFGRIFFRNSIGLGLPALICRGIHDAVEEGDVLQVNPRTGEIRNLTQGTMTCMEPLPEVAREILSAGGIVPLLRREYNP